MRTCMHMCDINKLLYIHVCTHSRFLNDISTLSYPVEQALAGQDNEDVSRVEGGGRGLHQPSLDVTPSWEEEEEEGGEGA